MVFGEVVEGMDLVKKIEAVGSAPAGATSSPVVIEDCGEMIPEGAPDGGDGMD